MAPKPTTMRIDPDLLRRAKRIGDRYGASRTAIIKRYIREGLARDERNSEAAEEGALD